LPLLATPDPALRKAFANMEGQQTDIQKSITDKIQTSKLMNIPFGDWMRLARDDADETIMKWFFDQYGQRDCPLVLLDQKGFYSKKGFVKRYLKKLVGIE
jgi:hypothetical protein